MFNQENLFYGMKVIMSYFVSALNGTEEEEDDDYMGVSPVGGPVWCYENDTYFICDLNNV